MNREQRRRQGFRGAISLPTMEEVLSDRRKTMNQLLQLAKTEERRQEIRALYDQGTEEIKQAYANHDWQLIMRNLSMTKITFPTKGE